MCLDLSESLDELSIWSHLSKTLLEREDFKLEQLIGLEKPGTACWYDGGGVAGEYCGGIYNKMNEKKRNR